MDDAGMEIVDMEFSPRTETTSIEKSPQQLILDYLLEHSRMFCALRDIREQGWSHPDGDQSFAQQRQRCDNPSPDGARYFYDMTKAIGNELNTRTRAFEILDSSDEPTALDMGMAPGGFSATIMKSCPETTLRAITLPPAEGGHAVQFQHKRLKPELCDINTLAGDMGLTSIPETHPAADKFKIRKVLGEDKFDLVICGCQVTRNHRVRESGERQDAYRLTLAQLVIALEHVKSKGTLVVVMHKPEDIHTAELLHIFSTFSEISLFKPKRAHAKRSSFYMVAKKVDNHSDQAIEVVKTWKKKWIDCTFGTADDRVSVSNRTVDDARELLENYGKELVKIGRPIWATQVSGIKRWLKTM